MSGQVFNARRQRHHLLPIVVSLAALLLSGCSFYMGDHKAVYDQQGYAEHNTLLERDIVIRKPHWMPDHKEDAI